MNLKNIFFSLIFLLLSIIISESVHSTEPEDTPSDRAKAHIASIESETSLLYEYGRALRDGKVAGLKQGSIESLHLAAICFDKVFKTDKNHVNAIHNLGLMSYKIAHCYKKLENDLQYTQHMRDAGMYWTYSSILGCEPSKNNLEKLKRECQQEKAKKLEERNQDKIFDRASAMLKDFSAEQMTGHLMRPAEKLLGDLHTVFENAFTQACEKSGVPSTEEMRTALQETLEKPELKAAQEKKLQEMESTLHDKLKETETAFRKADPLLEDIQKGDRSALEQFCTELNKGKTYTEEEIKEALFLKNN